MTSKHHPHTLAAAAHFGLTLPAHPEPPAPPALDIPDPANIILLTGPSATGKTTALRALASRAKKTHQIINLDTITLRPIPAIAHFTRLSAESAMRTLAAAGLADARAFLRTPAQLSTGQRARLTLAIALTRAASAPRKPLLTADEFAANLDPRTAATVARLLRKAITRTNSAAAIATPRTDLAAPLQPNTTATFSHTSACAITHTSPRQSALRLTFTPGTNHDYQSLAPLHYLPGNPATIEHILTARAGQDLAAVLTISRPTLNSAHRQLAWPNRYSTKDKPADARRINRELRTISRVIVDPRFAGQRIATRIVRHYLNNPLTPCTEAVAAMGTICPFFKRAGMTPYLAPPSKRNARLLDALAHANTPRHILADPRAAARALRNQPSRRFIEHELRLWARSSRSTDTHKDKPLPQLLTLAHQRLTLTPIAYAHTT